MSTEPACYLIERGHHSRPGKWSVEGRFIAGSPWRDGRPVNDETMREEVKGYRRTWPAFLARVRCPNGKILSELGPSCKHPRYQSENGKHICQTCGQDVTALAIERDGLTVAFLSDQQCDDSGKG